MVKMYPMPAFRKIAVVGAGNVGASTAAAVLARLSVDEIVLIDIRAEYGPYGKASFFDGSGVAIGGVTQLAVGNVFQWKGHRVDPETGLTYMRNRYFKSAWGRFLTQDALGGWGDPRSLGAGYAYVFNNPLTKSDRMGLQIDVGGIVGFTGGSGGLIVHYGDGTTSAVGSQGGSGALNQSERALAEMSPGWSAAVGVLSSISENLTATARHRKRTSGRVDKAKDPADRNCIRREERAKTRSPAKQWLD